jgi:hypothetical protein
MRPSIFISYSHRDSQLVGPIVALLRASEAMVFRDAEQLKPGKRWRNQIAAAIADSKTVVVFWCHHACTSSEVENEYKTAIAQDKDVLPLLIDDTPLPAQLSDFHYIDFRPVFAGAHANESYAPPRRSPIVGWIVIAVLLIAIGAAMLLSAPWVTTLTVSAVVMLTVVFWWFFKAKSTTDIGRSQYAEIHEQKQRLAAVIEQELRRRLRIGD